MCARNVWRRSNTTDTCYSSFARNCSTREGSSTMHLGAQDCDTQWSLHDVTPTASLLQLRGNIRADAPIFDKNKKHIEQDTRVYIRADLYRRTPRHSSSRSSTGVTLCEDRCICFACLESSHGHIIVMRLITAVE